jgi:hypothetical protein
MLSRIRNAGLNRPDLGNKLLVWFAIFSYISRRFLISVQISPVVVKNAKTLTIY